MKKLNVSNVTTVVGQLFKSGSVSHIQESYTEMLAAILQMINGGGNFAANTVYVLYGCVMTGSVTIGQPFASTAGVVLYNGELFFVDAFSTGSVVTSITASIVTTYRTATDGDPTDLTDASVVNVHEIRKIAIADAAGGIANFSAFLRITSGWNDHTIVNGDLAVSAGTYTIVGGTYRYVVVGKTLTITIECNLSSTETTNTFFEFLIPEGLSAYALFSTVGFAFGAAFKEFLKVEAASDKITFKRIDDAAFPTFATNSELRGTITFRLA